VPGGSSSAGSFQLAVLVTALVNGLALDELTEPDGIPGDLLRPLLALIDPERQPGQP
jgi:hypothetical protein